MCIFYLTVVILLLAGAEGGCLEKVAETPNMPGAQQWRCEEDGSYSAVQCHGSICYCADSEGANLNYTASIGQAMDCKCARKEAEFQRSGMLGLMFLCDSKGSFEPRQCIGSACYCADVNGEAIVGSARVHITDMESLVCE